MNLKEFRSKTIIEPFRIRSVEPIHRTTAAYREEAMIRVGHNDARAMLPHISPTQYPAWSLNNALYLLGGVRGVEIGTVMFGLQPDGSEKPAPMDLVRLAFPRRVYTQSHADYLLEVIQAAFDQRNQLPGYRIVEQTPTLRHFTVRMEPIE